MGRYRIHGALLAALVFIAVSCSGTPAAVTNEPAGTVQAALTAVQSGGFTKVADYTCAAKKSDITSAFGGGNLGALTAAGVSMSDLFSAMTIGFENVTTKEVSKSDTAAVVHLNADMKMTFDKDKMREVMKKMMAAQGAPADDATLDQVMTAMTASLTQTQKLDEDMNLVNEGGKWLVC